MFFVRNVVSLKEELLLEVRLQNFDPASGCLAMANATARELRGIVNNLLNVIHDVLDDSVAKEKSVLTSTSVLTLFVASDPSRSL